MKKTLRVERLLCGLTAVCGLALLAQACGSSGGSTGNTAGHGGTTGGTAGTTGSTGSAGTTGGAAGTTGGTAGTTGGTAGTTGGTAGTTGGTAGTTGGTAGTTGGTAGTTGGTAGAAGGTTGTGGGAAGRGGNAGAAGGTTGAAGRGGNGGGAGGRAGEGGAPNNDGGSVTDAAVHDGPTMSGGAYVRTAWTAVYSCTGTCPAQDSQDTVDADTKRAFDGNLGTRWSTGQYQQSTALMSKFPLYFTVDMKQVNEFTKITLNPGNQDMADAPGEMDVLVSDDGTTFTTVVSGHKPTSPATPGTDTITLTTPATGRYIQLKATMTIKQVNNALADRFWAIGEMNVYP
jgi:hypothetical protein